MEEMGFKRLLKNSDPSQESYVVSAFSDPKDPRFVYDEFYDRLSEAGV